MNTSVPEKGSRSHAAQDRYTTWRKRKVRDMQDKSSMPHVEKGRYVMYGQLVHCADARSRHAAVTWLRAHEHWKRCVTVEKNDKCHCTWQNQNAQEVEKVKHAHLLMESWKAVCEVWQRLQSNVQGIILHRRTHAQKVAKRDQCGVCASRVYGRYMSVSQVHTSFDVLRPRQ